jgi:glycosyltransferase involved in cell wall biosynthesis
MYTEITIITICKNNEKDIEYTLKSITSQIIDSDEYILIDGNSKDQTLNIIKKYSNNINIVISADDKGIYHAINKGITLASKSWILLIHAGDTLAINALLKIREHLNDEIDVIYGGINLVDANYNLVESKNSHNHEKLKNNMSLYHPATIINMKTYQKYGLYNKNIKISADYDLLLNIYLNGGLFKKIDLTICNFKNDGISSKNNITLTYEKMYIFYKYFGSFKALIVMINSIKISLLFKINKLTSLFK